MKHILAFIFIFVLVRPPLPSTPEPFEGSVAPANDGRGAYVVCVETANVYGGPDANQKVEYTLPLGTEVRVRERAKWIEEGWAMIKPAYWVKSSDLCKGDIRHLPDQDVTGKIW